MFKLTFEDFVPNVKIDFTQKKIIVNSEFYIYGTYANEDIASMIANNIRMHWGKKSWPVVFKNENFLLDFVSNAKYEPLITIDEIQRNQNLGKIYCRIENFSRLHVSYADDRGSNTGYFLIDNLLQEGSSTVSHEYGHMLGLWPDTPDAHPENKDYRGRGYPGIMYPRGTLVDAQFQYVDSVEAGQPGGTMDPKYRTVNEEDIAMVMTLLTHITEDSACLGKLTNYYHNKDIDPKSIV